MRSEYLRKMIFSFEISPHEYEINYVAGYRLEKRSVENTARVSTSEKIRFLLIQEVCPYSLLKI